MKLFFAILPTPAFILGIIVYLLAFNIAKWRLLNSSMNTFDSGALAVMFALIATELILFIVTFVIEYRAIRAAEKADNADARAWVNQCRDL